MRLMSTYDWEYEVNSQTIYEYLHNKITFTSVSASLLIHSVIFFVVVVRYLEMERNTQYNLAV